VVLRLFRRLALRLALVGRTLRRSDRDDKSLDQKATVKVTTKGRKVGIDCAQVDINKTLLLFVEAGSAPAKTVLGGGRGAAPDVPSVLGRNIKHRHHARCFS